MKQDINDRVQRLIDGIIGRGGEQALQVAAYWRGELVVDAWAGLANPATGMKTDGNTLFPVFSTTKGIAATAVHILAERGKLDYEAPIAAYWPEFGVNGKAAITLRQALDHTAALPHMPDCANEAEICDWGLMCRRIAGLAPLWPPGTRTYYHAITYGWLVGEPACRVDGRDFGRIVREEICRPLGIADAIFIGLPPSEDERVAVFESDPNPPAPQPPPVPPPPDPVAGRAIPPLVCPLERWINQPATWRGCIPASNGIMTAKGIARHYAALVGEVDGVRLLSPKTLARALETPRTGEPESALRGLGYMLHGPDNNRASAFGHGGAGGSLGLADVRGQLAIGIAKNRMGTSACETTSAAEQIVQEIRNAVGAWLA